MIICDTYCTYCTYYTLTSTYCTLVSTYCTYCTYYTLVSTYCTYCTYYTLASTYCMLTSTYCSLACTRVTMQVLQELQQMDLSRVCRTLFCDWKLEFGRCVEILP